MHDQLVSFRQNEEFCEVTIDKDRCNALCGQNKASIKNASMRENSDFKEGITMRYFNDQVELQEADGVSLCGMPNPVKTAPLEAWDVPSPGSRAKTRSWPRRRKR